MNIIIVGVGKVGATLVENFVREKHDVVVIDIDRSEVEYAVNTFDVRGIIGSCVQRDVLIDAGIQTADLLIACTPRDETNILACILAKKLGVKRTIARVRDPEYFKEMENMRADLGLDLAFNPERRTALAIDSVLKFPSAQNVESFANGKAIIAEFLIEEGNPVIGKSLIQIAKDYSSNVLFGVVERGEKIYIPRGDFVIQEKDRVHIIGSEDAMTAFCKKVKIFKPHAKNVMLIGGGKVAYYLALELIRSNIEVKIIERDEDCCKKLAGLLPRATIICGNGTDQSVLEEENLKEFDACVTLTGIDESNVIVSLFAKDQKVPKVITKINRAQIMQMVNTLGLGTVVSPRMAIVDYIIGFVRANKADAKKGVNTFYRLNGKAEALEFIVEDSCKRRGIPLKKLKIKNNAIISAIVRGDKFILPSGDSVMTTGDKVIVITTIPEITELSQVFR